MAALAQAELTAPIELTIRLTDDAGLRELNRKFRGIDDPTDVLSFGGDLRDYLGDIAISMERCAAQAQEFGHDVDDELALLVIDGALHLLGCDHDTQARKRRMWAAQDRAFEAIGRANPLVRRDRPHSIRPHSN
jgi:probable rRNA maturation factor